MRPHTFLACTLLFTRAACGQTLLLVDGGDWTPDAATTSEVVRSVETAFLRAAADQRGAVPEWNSYTIQHQGRVVGGVRLVEISGACRDIAESMMRTYDLKKVFVGIMDGGPCVFSASYDADAKRLVYFRFNGFA